MLLALGAEGGGFSDGAGFPIYSLVFGAILTVCSAIVGRALAANRDEAEVRFVPTN